MAAIAVAPLRRRTLERQGMTPEEELQLLVQEQKADDTYIVYRPNWTVSLDGPATGAEGIVSDYLGTDEDGELINFLPRERSALTMPALIPHGTLGGYNNHKCRCCKCRAAVAEYRRNKRAEQ